MNTKIKEFVILACLIALGVLSYIITDKNKQIEQNDYELNRTIDSLNINITYYQQTDSIHKDYIDSMTLLIEVKPKFRNVYINNHTQENDKIENLYGLNITHRAYLDSICPDISK